MSVRRLTVAAGLAALMAMPVVPALPHPAIAAYSHVHPDFNGDGYADLPIPVPGEDLRGVVDAGAIHVLYGSIFGPRVVGSQFINQGSAGARGAPHTHEFFGLAWTAGDFDGDGYDDLAVGIVGDHVGGARRGSVQVFFGSAQGLTTVGDMLLNEALPGFPGSPEAGDLFGYAVAAGDFDGDGYDDLAVGNPGEAWGGGDGFGTVYVFHGRGYGMSISGVQRFNQATKGITGTAEDGDRFGMSLAAGDFDHDGRDDLAIGAPGEQIGARHKAGVVHVLYGAATGVSNAGDDLWSQAGPGVPGGVGTSNYFGYSLAAGRLDGNNYDDLAIGTLGDRVGAVKKAGSVIILRGRHDGVTDVGSRRLSYATHGVKGPPVPGDLFGSVLTAADFDGDGRDDLAVTALARSVGGAPYAGEVVVFRSDGSPRPVSGVPRRLNQNSDGVGGIAESGDLFGSLLAAGDFSGDGRADLCIGAAGETFSGVTHGGIAHVVFGRELGLSGRGSLTLSQNSPGMPNQAEDVDIFGTQILM